MMDFYYIYRSDQVVYLHCSYNRMRNSKLGHLSIGIPTESRLKTFTDLDDRSIIVNEEDELPAFPNHDQFINQNLLLSKWLACRDKIPKKYVSEADSDPVRNGSCYMLQFEEFGEIVYRKKITASGRDRDNTDKRGEAQISKEQARSTKVYLKLIINMLNNQTSTYISRTLEPNILELQQKTSNMYKVTQPHLAIFFHSKLTSQNNTRIRLQLIIVESVVSDLQEIVQHEEYIGFCDVDPFKGLKNRQKTQVYSDKLNMNLDAYVAYTVLVSDSFKILQKLIPPNCLCSSDESIAGLAGRKLPNNIATLHYPIEYTELHSLRVDIIGVDVPDSLIKSRIKESQIYAKNLYNLDDVSVKVKEVRLEGIFHNGWDKFSEASIKIEDKMEIQKKSSKKASAEVIKIKHYTSEELFNLPFIFLDEESVLIFQVVCNIEIKQKTGSAITHNLSLPLCYSYYIINKISVDEKQVRVFYAGDGLNSGSGEFGVRKNEAIGGRIQFYMNIESANKMHLSKHLLTIHSNKSHVNTEVDRILLEKERMIRQNKKLKQMNRIKKIELNQEVPILDTTNFKENLYKNEIDRMRQERKQKEEVLEYLRRKLNELSPHLSEDMHSEQLQGQNYQEYQRAFANRAIPNTHYDAVFYKAALDKNSIRNGLLQFNPQLVKIHSFPLFQNAAASKLCQSGQVPLDVIKTQLLQKNYSYGIFINWVSLLPVCQDRRLPRKFYFLTSVFTHENIQSCVCSINESTGEIVVVDNPKEEKQPEQSKQTKTLKEKTTSGEAEKEAIIKAKTQKISYVEIGPDPKVSNNQSNFIEFISYLFHSELQVKVIDAISGIQFGEGFYKLKDIIRMRRNEVEVTKDVWISKQGEAKAKLKIQMKSIRKQPTHQPAKPKTEVSPLETLSMEPQARQLQRIAQFKRQRQGESSGRSKIERMINQELTKEEMMVRVFRMKGEFIKVEVKNVKNITESYQVVINDPDKPFLVNEELVVVNRALYERVVETGWWKYLLTLDNRYSLAIIVDSNNCFELNPGQTGFILLFYYSDRKYQGSYLRDLHSLPLSNNNQTHPHMDPSKILKVYNHSRVVDLTLHNSSNRYLQCLYKLHIVPQPDPCTINYKYVRKQNSKMSLSIPYVGGENFIVYIDDPTIISTLNQQQGSVNLDCVVGGEGQSKHFNASILSPYPENRMIANYHFELCGACEITVEGKLWEMQDLLVDLHSSICLKKGLEYVLVLVEDERTVTIRQKNPVKVNQKQAKTIIRLAINPTMVGLSHHELSIINPIDFSTIYRYTIKLNTQEPQINEKITLRIKLTDKILEQPFGFRNDSARRQKYRIISTHPHILWCKQDNIEVEAKGEKKIKIVIHAEQVMESEVVILSFLGEKGSINYLFILELDNQL